MNLNILVVDITTYTTFDFLQDGETEEQLLNRANIYKSTEIRHLKISIKKLESENKDTKFLEELLNKTKQIDYQVMTWDEFENGRKKFLLSGDIKEITKEEYENALNILPPLKWCEIDGVEMFCMSEMYTSTFTTQYAKIGNKYYCKMVDVSDKGTWLYKLLRKDVYYYYEKI